MFISRKMISKSILAAGTAALLATTACGSDDEATKDEEPVKVEPEAEEAPAAEEPAPAEEPAEEPAAEEPAYAGPSFDGAARVTEAADEAGGHAVRLTKVTADGGYAACGLQDNDVVAKINGGAVPTGRPGVDALITACKEKQPITVDRGGEKVMLNQ